MEKQIKENILIPLTLEIEKPRLLPQPQPAKEEKDDRGVVVIEIL